MTEEEEDPLASGEKQMIARFEVFCEEFLIERNGKTYMDPKAINKMDEMPKGSLKWLE